MMLTVIADSIDTIGGNVDGDKVPVSAETLTAAIGWEFKPEGLCRGEACVPADVGLDGGLIDLVGAAEAVGRSVVVDHKRDIVAVSVEAEARARVLGGLEAADFTLPDFEGVDRSFHEWSGTKRLLFAWSSW